MCIYSGYCDLRKGAVALGGGLCLCPRTGVTMSAAECLKGAMPKAVQLKKGIESEMQ